jgi:serine/threonine protein phosphatase 1
MAQHRRFVIGDIHGANIALTQCFDRSEFDRQNDLLICLGDLCDRWPDVDKVFDTLLEIQNLVLLLGNHDYWALEWFLHQSAPDIWLMQGGNVTLNAYRKGVPESHVDLLTKALLFHQLDNKLFVHGGYNPERDIQLQDRDVLLWDRSLIKTALIHRHDRDQVHLTSYDEVYVGHTPTINFGATTPIKACEIFLMDTGAGWPGGVLTMMDIDSKDYFQSDPVDQLYMQFK